MKTKELSAWIEAWPWTKTLAAAGVIGFALTHLLGMLGVLALVIVDAVGWRQVGAEDRALLAEARAWFNDGLQWSIVAATGGVLGLGLKRAATKPDVVTAEADAQVKVLEATARAVPPLTPQQATDVARSVTADQEQSTVQADTSDEVPEPVSAAPLAKPSPGGGER